MHDEENLLQVDIHLPVLVFGDQQHKAQSADYTGWEK